MSTNIFESTSFDDLLRQAGVSALNPEISVDKTAEQIAEERTESYRVSASVLAEDAFSQPEAPKAQVWGSTEPSKGVVSDEEQLQDGPVTGSSQQAQPQSAQETTPANPWGAWGGAESTDTQPVTNNTTDTSWESLMSLVPNEKPSNTNVIEPVTNQPTQETASSDDLKPLIRQVVVEVLSDILTSLK